MEPRIKSILERVGVIAAVAVVKVIINRNKKMLAEDGAAAIRKRRMNPEDFKRVTREHK